MKKLNSLDGRAVSILFLFGGVVSVHAQDSLYHTILPDSVVSDNTHHLKLKTLVIPTVLTGTSALCVHNGWLTKQREDIQDKLSAKGEHKVKIDNYLQYTPMLAVYGLNLFGVNGKHKFWDRTGILAMSYATMGILVNGMKYTFKEKRPDTNARNSFPSGHTATAFMCAEFLYQEYKEVSPWIGYSGYLIATATGYLRIYNDRHYLNDVVAGACIGIISTKFAYWLYPKIFTKSKCRHTPFQAIGMPFYTNKTLGMNVSMLF